MRVGSSVAGWGSAIEAAFERVFEGVFERTPGRGRRGLRRELRCDARRHPIAHHSHHGGPYGVERERVFIVRVDEPTVGYGRGNSEIEIVVGSAHADGLAARFTELVTGKPGVSA